MSLSPIVSGSIDSQARFESMRPPAYKKRVFQRHRDLSLEYKRRIQSIERETKLIASRIIKIKSEFEGRKKVLEEAEHKLVRPILPPIVKSDAKKTKRKDHKSRNGSKTKNDSNVQKDNSTGQLSKSDNSDPTTPEAPLSILRKIETIPEDPVSHEDVVIDKIAETNDCKTTETSSSGSHHTQSDSPADPPKQTNNSSTESPSQDDNKKQNTERKQVDKNNNRVNETTKTREKTPSAEVLDLLPRSTSKQVRIEHITSRDAQSKTIDWVTNSEYSHGQIKKSKSRKAQGRKTVRTISSGSRRRKRVLLFRVEKMDGDVTYINEMKKPSELERRFFASQTHHLLR